MQTLPFRRLLWYFFFLMLFVLLARLAMLEIVSVLDLELVAVAWQEVAQLMVLDLEVGSELAECERWEMTGFLRGMAGGSEGGGWQRL